MTKRDWTVLVVRGFGLYLLAYAIFAIPGFAQVVTAIVYSWDKMFPTQADTSPYTEGLRLEYLVQAVSAISRFAICGYIGFALIRSKSLSWIGLPELVES
jgi:hypothetical protein